MQKEISDPRDLHERCPNSTQDRKRAPFFAPRDGQQTDIEQRDVAEQSRRIVLSGGQKDWREKAAGDSENRDHERIHSHCEEKRRCRDERHQRKRWDQSEERKVVERSAGEGNGIENENAGRTQGLRGDDVFLAFQRRATNDQRDAGKKSDRNP